MADGDAKEKPAWLTLPLLMPLGIQTIGVIVVLVRMYTDIANLQAHHREIDTSLARIDQAGTRNIPVLLERLTSLEKTNANEETRINNISSRLDAFIGQVNRLETPLSKKVEGLEIALVTTRDGANVHYASSTARFENILARQNTIIDKQSMVDREFIELRNRLGVLDGLVRELRNLSDQRQAVVTRAEKGFEDIALLKQQITNVENDVRRYEERLTRIVSALDSTYEQLQQHLRDTGARNAAPKRRN